MYMSDTIIKRLNECKNEGAAMYVWRICVWLSEYNLIVKGRVLFKTNFPLANLAFVLAVISLDV